MQDPRTLMERVFAPSRPQGTPYQLLVESIRQNLNDLFGSFKGSSMAEPDYGLPDGGMLVRGLEERLDARGLIQPDIESYKLALRQVIERYEPRLRLHEISAYAENSFTLRFELRADVMDSGLELGPFHASAGVDPTGRIRIS